MSDYELIDFGAGRVLERFGQFTLDRYSQAATEFNKRTPNVWNKADAFFVEETRPDEFDSINQRGLWKGPWNPQPWSISIAQIVFELKCTPFGHVGIFPEQISNWRRITDNLLKLKKPDAELRVMNLFAYTGGSTLAAASTGASVVHVDSAKNVVAWARKNAELSDLATAPIRWIADDAVKFVQRELKRSRKYDAIILDPPTYGHGTGKEVWKIARDLPILLQSCFELIKDNSGFICLTCHSPQFDGAKLKTMLNKISPRGTIQTFPLSITARTGAVLPLGNGVIYFP